MRVIFLLSILLLSARPGCAFQAVTITYKHAGNSVIISARSAYLNNYVVKINLLGKNTWPASGGIVAASNGRQNFVVCRVKRLIPFEPSSFSFTWKWETGRTSNIVSSGFPYRLPYLPGEKHKVIQAFFGTFSHQKGTRSQYSVDFAMPVGTPVCAARGGEVIGIRVDSTIGGPTKKFLDDDNWITIDHGDGTYGEYIHLEPGGTAVVLGQKVVLGQVIGYSGNTGFSTEPHLHFDVYHDVDLAHWPTIPFKFRLRNGKISELTEGEVY